MTEHLDDARGDAGRGGDPSRRRFIGTVGGASLGGVLAGCGESPPTTGTTESAESGLTPTMEGYTARTDTATSTDRDETSPFGDFEVVDGHVHILARRAYGRGTLVADEMVAWMDDHGIDRAVLLPLESPTSFEVLSPTWWNLDQAAAHPDRLIPFGVIDPRIVVWGRQLLEDRIATWVEEGARGFGEFKVNLPVDEKRMRIVYQNCGYHGLPIVVHMDDVRATDDPGLPGLELILHDYPHVDFIMHGPGWWANIDGTATRKDMGRYPDGEVTEPGAVERLLSDYDNVYASIDSGSGWNALSRDVEYAQSLLETHHEQIVYGTDKIYEGQEIGQFALMDTFDLPEAAWQNILSANLLDLLADPP